MTRNAAPRGEMTAEEFARIDRLLGAVIERSTEFTSFQVDFALHNANRLERYRTWTFFSDKQLDVIKEIERRIADEGSNA